MKGKKTTSELHEITGINKKYICQIYSDLRNSYNFYERSLVIELEPDVEHTNYWRKLDCTNPKCDSGQNNKQNNKILGYCSVCYKRYLIHGDPNYIDERFIHGDCSECDKPFHAKYNKCDYCYKHYHSAFRYDDALYIERMKEKYSKCEIPECKDKFFTIYSGEGKHKDFSLCQHHNNSATRSSEGDALAVEKKRQTRKLLRKK